MAEFVPAHNPDELIPGWTSELLPSLRRLKFLDGDPVVGHVKGLGNGPIIQAKVKLVLPIRPLVRLHAVETVWLQISTNSQWHVPDVLLARPDVPALPHAPPRVIDGTTYRSLCLLRTAGADWWVGKGLGVLFARIKEWLGDAAAGNLVKADDPYEPAMPHGARYFIEVPRGSLPTTPLASTGRALFLARETSKDPGTFVVGNDGDLNVLAFYQTVPRDDPWPLDLSTPQEVFAELSRVGLPNGEIKLRVEHASSLTRFLVLVGLRRPREVLGASNADEWIGYVFQRASKKDEWKCSQTWVRESLSTELAARLNGRIRRKPAPKIVLIGAGSLGGYVAESLLRSGTNRMTVFDPDVLMPHNLARHGADRYFVGRYKVKWIQMEAIMMFGLDQDSVAIHAQDVLTLSTEQWAEAIAGATCIVDCSASLAVQAFLSSATRCPVPVISAFQISSGKGTVLLMSRQAAEGPSLRELELALIHERDRVPAVAEWLAASTEPIQIGAGCRSISARVPDSLSRLGAAWVAESVLRVLDDDTTTLPDAISVLTTEPGIPPGVNVKSLAVPAGRWVSHGEWRMWVPAHVEAEIRRHVLNAHPNETAGILVGRHDPRDKTIHITGVGSPPRDNVGTPHGCVRGMQGVAQFLAVSGRREEGSMVYIGEWHGHPPGSSTQMSGTDKQQAAKNIAAGESALLPAVVLISNGRELSAHILTAADLPAENAEFENAK